MRRLVCSVFALAGMAFARDLAVAEPASTPTSHDAVPVASPSPQASPVKALATDEQILAILNERVQSKATKGIVVGIWEQGKSRIVSAGNSRDGKEAAKVDGDTIFEIGSITKVFTATILADMVGRGEIKLEDPISKYLPDGVHAPSKDGRQITFLDLATHRSGLPRMPTNFDPKDPGNPFADYTADKMWAFLTGYTLTRAPGAEYEYSNYGMGLAGDLLARRAGKSYSDLLTERVLRPLGMNDTAAALTPEMKKRAADGHDLAGHVTPHWDLLALGGAGAINSNVKDLLKFVSANVNPPDTPLGKALAETHKVRADTGVPGLDIALAWHVKHGEIGDIVWHNGGTGGFHSFLAFDDKHKVGVVVLSNSTASIDDIGIHLLDPSVPVDHPVAPKERSAVAISEGALEAFVGEYALAPTFSITITREGKQLYEQATGQQRVPIYPESETSFFLKVVDAQISFEKDDSGKVVRMVLHQGGHDVPGERKQSSP